MKNNILITGGAGYVGAVLVPSLLLEGHKVTVLDLMIYGDDVIQKHPNLKIIKGDIRNEELFKNVINGIDIVIHLACISNDPSFELNPNLGKSINLDSFTPLVEISRNFGVSRFIFASSSSVYGIKNVPNVHEDMTLEPLTDYSKYKAECENILFNYQSNDFTTVVIRPATVCGYSPRQRLDVVVNIFTNYAYHKRHINVFGGNQLRPNINIKDLIDVYKLIIKAPKNIVAGQIFNAGYENQTVLDLADTVKQVIGNDVKLNIVQTDDNRSYHISSEKISKLLDFKTNYNISDAVGDLKKAFQDNLLEDSFNNAKYFNIKKMQLLNLK